MLDLDLPRLKRDIQAWGLCQTRGRVRGVHGLIECALPAAVGDQCEIIGQQRRVPAEVIGFSNGIASLVPFEHVADLHPDMPVVRTGRGLTVPVGSALMGRVLDGLARPLDGRGPLPLRERRTVRSEAPPALERARIQTRFATGQRAIDGLLTFGRGQRVGIFAGSGVG